MVVFAYTDCGLSLEKFMSLSFFEWHCEVEKYKKKQKAVLDEWEGHGLLMGQLMALIANVNRNKKYKATPYERTDFVRLSFDKEKPDNKGRLMTPEEVEVKFKKVNFNKGRSLL